VRRSLAPLYAAGFVTAFGSHAVAATAGAETTASTGAVLLRLGLLVAVYDLAEVFLKPVFGALADHVGPKRVVVGGLLAFSVVSLIGGLVPGSVTLIPVRFGQGAAAAAFSPAASAVVGRLASPEVRGRYFGRYGSWKSLGYAAGPVVGAALAGLGGLALLQGALAAVALIAAIWVLLRCPAVEVLPRRRVTVLDTVRRATSWSFVQPVVVLAATAGALVAAVAFLPAGAARTGAGIIAAGSVATALALASSVTQPVAGRLMDEGRVTFRTTAPLSLLCCAAGVLLAALAPSFATILVGAVLVGLGVGASTPIAFATLAARSDPAELGRTMGSAELGRELGDAGAPALVGLVATTGGLAGGLVALSIGLASAAAVAVLPPARSRPEVDPRVGGVALR
jgi:MFS family permease